MFSQRLTFIITCRHSGDHSPIHRNRWSVMMGGDESVDDVDTDTFYDKTIATSSQLHVHRVQKNFDSV